MDNLEKQFDDKIEKTKFNFLEISGFQAKPMLAIKAGMALGYQMACDNIKNLFKKEEEENDFIKTKF